jgi:hypothetical protein
MRVLFFDIDGVLNTRATPNPRKLPYVVDQRLVTRFKRLLSRTKARPIMISAWRYDPAGLFSAKHHGIPCRGIERVGSKNLHQALSWVTGVLSHAFKQTRPARRRRRSSCRPAARL